MSTADQVMTIIAKQLKRDPSSVTLDLDLQEAGFESLDVIETVFEIEDQWDIDINFNANTASMEQFRTVADVVRLVDEAIAAKGAV
ncbi:acyl carrier protein [Sphingomonas turrisvirgatae]|uniref:Carrier domain-containing protein n=1 Tax=Sphingomonas turrisvirgatae TaxID=1888892 RepID=A0A1E3LRW6_9SPHN|nr:phosphopantetheine-binding protein [Sphingomonas turrisvirgatae]ODP36489.1 hypothetical protein BFL28_05745 [Sphingomonas turrisvirgatae]